VTSALATGIRAADPRAVARGLTVVENDPAAATALLASLSDVVGRAHRVGVTGPPGAGKSTLIGALARAWREAGRRVGVVAVDPSSPYTGGALLGDRIRMAEAAADPGVFIRSLATRGALGGLARAAQDAADVLDAAGYDPVVLETVGVGQSEVAVAGAADTVLVVLAPGSGDSIQAMKSGLIEIADLLVVNQADRDGAEALVADLMAAAELKAAGERPRVLTTVATRGAGVDALAAAVDAHRRSLAAGEGLLARRRARAGARLREEVDRLRAGAFWGARAGDLDRLSGEVAAGRMTVAEAAGRLLRGGTVPGGTDSP
jgi:LAO/AO transport system kinase